MAPSEEAGSRRAAERDEAGAPLPGAPLRGRAWGGGQSRRRARGAVHTPSGGCGFAVASLPARAAAPRRAKACAEPRVARGAYVFTAVRPLPAALPRRALLSSSRYLEIRERGGKVGRILGRGELARSGPGWSPTQQKRRFLLNGMAP
ncbi:uncharacterized protein LOC110260652 [Sus scrofa]|uniref:uncharacterized protein LOC110260652 n=1 Tax=Sus scrofa TaxID=9823 RepID=UPI000A2B4F8D|nr:uncharacterized protein LOC110260652 [Sus scrofa]